MASTVWLLVVLKVRYEPAGPVSAGFDWAGVRLAALLAVFLFRVPWNTGWLGFSVALPLTWRIPACALVELSVPLLLNGWLNCMSK